MAWVDWEFEANIHTPDKCPLALDTPGQDTTLTGEVKFPASSPGNEFQKDRASDAFGSYVVLDAFDHQIENDFLGYNYDFTTDEFKADILNSYPAGLVAEPQIPPPNRFRDTIVFETDIFENWNPPTTDNEVRGGVDLPYAQTPRGDVDGPSAAERFQSFSLSVVPENGLEPLNYAWTQDGTPIGSNSASVYVPGLAEGNYTFAVAITDAEGDSGQMFHPVAVTVDGTCVDTCQ